MWPLFVSSIVNLRLGSFTMTLKYPRFLVFVADAFGVFIQLGRVVGSGEDVFQEDGVRNSDGAQVLHGITQGSRLHVLVALRT